MKYPAYFKSMRWDVLNVKFRVCFIFSYKKDSLYLFLWNSWIRVYTHTTQQSHKSIQVFHNVTIGYWDQLALQEPEGLIYVAKYYTYREEQRLVQFCDF